VLRRTCHTEYTTSTLSIKICALLKESFDNTATFITSRTATGGVQKAFSQVNRQTANLLFTFSLQLDKPLTFVLRRNNTQWVSRSLAFCRPCSRTGRCVSIIPRRPCTHAYPHDTDVAISSRYSDGIRWCSPLPQTNVLTFRQVGLDAAGKTTILYKLKLGEIVTTIPTIGRRMTCHFGPSLLTIYRL
jgi:hypothetical protein